MPVRWESLFADLEAELDAAAAAELAGEVAERTRGERAAVLLADRLRAAIGADVELVLLGGTERLRGRLEASGPDWSLLVDAAGVEHLVPHGGLAAASGLGVLAEPSSSAVEARLDFASGLRGIARRRAAVRLRLTDGGAWVGTIDRVGADALDLAVHAPGEARRARAVRQVAVIPLRAIAAVRAD